MIRACCRVGGGHEQRLAGHVQSPGLLHAHGARSPRRLARSSTSKGHSALFDKREADHSLIRMALRHGPDHPVLHVQ